MTHLDPDLGYSYAAGWEATACPDPAGFVMSGGDAVTTDTRIDPATTEARCRRLMAEHAAIEARGWTSQRARDDLREMIDAELDAWLEAMSA